MYKLLQHTPKFANVPSRKFATFKIAQSSEFQEKVIKASHKTPVIVDCKADWCGPCKVLGPKLEKLVENSKGAVDLAIVDIDDHPEIAEELQVSAIPSVFAYKDGKIVNTFIGNVPDATLQKFVDALK